MNCIEHDLSKLASIIAYPCGDLKFAAPVFALATVQDGSPVPAGSGAPAGTRISFTRDTAKCSDHTNVSVAGYVHTLSLEWETQGVSPEDYDQFVRLQQIPHEFILTFFGGLRKALRTDPTSYQFIFNEDNGTMKCSATLINGQGLTLIK